MAHHLYQLSDVCTQFTDRHPFNGLFSRTTWVNWRQKSITILDFDEAGDDGVAVAVAGPYANHLHLTARLHLITEFFTRQMFFLMHYQQCQSTRLHCQQKGVKYFRSLYSLEAVTVAVVK